MTRLVTIIGLTVTIALLACSGDPVLPEGASQITAPEGTVVFQVAVQGESFHVAVHDAEVVGSLAQLLKSGDRASVLMGDLMSGDGGFNAPWDWHLAPTSVQVADVATEVCDGRPSHVQESLSYWLETVKQYCPWSVEIVARK